MPFTPTPIQDLHLAEYNALRAEQRTRLDCANRIINYYALLVAAASVGFVALWDKGKAPALFTGLLLFPAIVLPFALTQQNEEIMVRRIGAYLRELRERLPLPRGEDCWIWERHHTEEKSVSLWTSAFFKAALLILLPIISYSFAVGLYLHGVHAVDEKWYTNVALNQWPRFMKIFDLFLFVLDTAMLAICGTIAIQMSKYRYPQWVASIKSAFQKIAADVRKDAG